MATFISGYFESQWSKIAGKSHRLKHITSLLILDGIWESGLFSHAEKNGPKASQWFHFWRAQNPESLDEADLRGNSKTNRQHGTWCGASPLIIWLHAAVSHLAELNVWLSFSLQCIPGFGSQMFFRLYVEETFHLGRLAVIVFRSVVNSLWYEPEKSSKFDDMPHLVTSRLHIRKKHISKRFSGSIDRLTRYWHFLDEKSTAPHDKTSSILCRPSFLTGQAMHAEENRWAWYRLKQ